MRKILFMIAAVCGLLTACNNGGNEWIEVDHSADLVGTWTCMEADYAEALVIGTDGSVVSTGAEGNEFWESVKGNIKVVNNKMTLTFEDGDNFDGRFEMLVGEAFTIFEEDGKTYTYRYCATDLKEEIIGMWVSTQTPSGNPEDMLVTTIYENGKMTMTVQASDYIYADFLNQELDYVFVGDLLFKNFYGENPADGYIRCQPSRLVYSPNGTSLGDILIENLYAPYKDGLVEITASFLRIKQSLDLANTNYDYNNIYISNVKAKDAEFEFAGQTLNLATMDGKFLDKMMKNLLFNVSFPSSDEIIYNCYYNGESVSMPSPIVVDGNKMTIKKSANNPAFKDIDVWAFQDQDNTQMHMYMPTYAFENFIANTAVELMAQEGKLDLSDTEAVVTIYDGVADAIETINVSFIFKDATRAL